MLNFRYLGLIEKKIAGVAGKLGQEIGDYENQGAGDEAAIEAGAKDVVSGEDGHEIICSMEDLHGVVDVLASVLGEPQAASIVWKPQNDVPVDAEAAEMVLKFMDALDDLDDVQNVYANFDIADEVMEKLSS